MHSTPDAADEILANPETDESLYSTLPKLPSLYTDFCMGRLNSSVTGLADFSIAAFDFPLKTLFPGNVQTDGAAVLGILESLLRKVQP